MCELTVAHDATEDVKRSEKARRRGERGREEDAKWRKRMDG